MSLYRVLVVDDHSLFRRGLVDLVGEEHDFDVVGEARNAEEALRVWKETSPDVVMMDVHMAGGDGVEAVAALTALDPDVKVLMLTAVEEPETLYAAMAAGARGYVLKTATAEEILHALRQIVQGWVIVSPEMGSQFLGAFKPPEEPASPEEAPDPNRLLTRREREILDFITRGYTNAEIAAEITVGEETVKTHVRSILSKLQAHSKRELVGRSRELADLLRDGGPGT